MLLTIQRLNGAYYHNKGRIILFESQSEAEQFLNMFTQYSVQRLMSEGRGREAMSAPMRIMSESEITPATFDINSVRCGIVYASELLKKVK